MNKIAIVTDSSCDIPKEMMEEHQIHMLPLKIIYKDQEYRDRVEISPEEIYKRFSEEVPTSSLPSPEDTHILLEKISFRRVHSRHWYIYIQWFKRDL